MTLYRDAIPSPNYSSRGSASVTHIVVHTAEGALTYQSLGHYFESPSAGVSSHTGIDDTPGAIGEYVRRDGKAWTASNANPWSVQAELCGFAAWDTDEWFRHPVMLENTAAWIAEEAAAYDLPLDNIAAIATDPSSVGVCQHNDLGAMGGGHWDCGPGFPIAHVLDLARGGSPSPPIPPARPKDDDMPYYLFSPESGGQWWITNLRTDSRPCESLDDAINTDYFLRELGKVEPLVCNRKADGAVAGPIAVDDHYLNNITKYAHPATPSASASAAPEQSDD